MSYLDKYKAGGERTEQTKKAAGAKYLNKRYEHDFDAEVVCVKKIVSQNPRTKGVEKFIAEVKPTKIRKTTQKGKDLPSGIDPLEVGEVYTHLFDLTSTNENAMDKALEEMVSILAAASNTKEGDLFRDLASVEAGQPAKIDRFLEDDGASLVGNMVSIRSLPESNGFRNLEWDSAAK